MMKGVLKETKPVIDPQVKSIKKDIDHLLSRIDEGNERLDQVERENGLLNRENVALRQVLRVRFSSLGGSLGVPGAASIVGCIVMDVDGNRIEVSMS